MEPVKFETLGQGNPKQIFTERLNSESFGKYLEEVLNGMPSLRERTDKYHPLGEHAEDLAKSKLEMKELLEGRALEKIESYLRSTNKTLDDFEYYKFKARYANGVALYDTDEKRVVRLVKTGAES